MRITIKNLNEKYPDYEVIKKNFGYSVKHLPTGKVSVCILGKTLDKIERFIANSIENNDLNDRSHFRLPTE